MPPDACPGARPALDVAPRARQLEIGDRSPGDAVHDPDDDLAVQVIGGACRFSRKDGSPFEPRPA